MMKLNHCMDEDLSKTESKKESTSVYGEAVRVFSRPQRVQASVSAPKGVYVFILWLPEGKDTKTTLTWMQKPQKKKNQNTIFLALILEITILLGLTH